MIMKEFIRFWTKPDAREYRIQSYFLTAMTAMNLVVLNATLPHDVWAKVVSAVVSGALFVRWNCDPRMKRW